MAHVFISYSSKDEAQALAIADMLEAHDIHCWIACRSLPVGSSFTNAIHDAIRECQVFLLLITRNSVDSMDVLNELTLACRQRNQANRLILPLMLEGLILPPGFDYHLANVQIHPFEFDDTLSQKEIIGTIRAHITPQDNLNERWGNLIEIMRTEFLQNFQPEVLEMDPEEAAILNGLYDFARTSSPKDFMDLLSELMELSIINDEAVLAELKEKFTNTIIENQGRVPDDFSNFFSVVPSFLENASAEEVAEFTKGLFLGLAASEIQREDFDPKSE